MVFAMEIVMVITMEIGVVVRKTDVFSFVGQFTTNLRKHRMRFVGIMGMIQWLVYRGQWLVKHDRRLMVYHGRLMNDDRRRMHHDAGTMNYDVWLVHNDIRSMVYGR